MCRSRGHRPPRASPTRPRDAPSSATPSAPTGARREPPPRARLPLLPPAAVFVSSLIRRRWSSPSPLTHTYRLTVSSRIASPSLRPLPVAAAAAFAAPEHLTAYELVVVPSLPVELYRARGRAQPARASPKHPSPRSAEPCSAVPDRGRTRARFPSSPPSPPSTPGLVTTPVGRGVIFPFARAKSREKRTPVGESRRSPGRSAVVSARRSHSGARRRRGWAGPTPGSLPVGLRGHVDWVDPVNTLTWRYSATDEPAPPLK